MKKITPIIILIFNFLGAYAQKNEIRVTINHLSYGFGNATNDSTEFQSQQSFQILPSIGFSHILSNKIAIGLDLGYRNSNHIDISQYNYSTSPNKQNIYNSLPMKEYFFCPNVCKQFKFNSLKLQTSIILPVEYVTKREQHTKQEFISKSTNSVVTEYNSITIWPKYLVFGIYANTGLFVRVVKNIYIGTNLGVGLINEKRFGEVFNSQTEKQNGTVTLYSERTLKYSRNLIGGFDLRPSISLHYEF